MSESDTGYKMNEQEAALVKRAGEDLARFIPSSGELTPDPVTGVYTLNCGPLPVSRSAGSLIDTTSGDVTRFTDVKDWE